MRETGLCLPDLFNLCRLAELFGVSVDTLLGTESDAARARHMIGIDGGGTKTEFVLFEETGKIRKRILLESTNPNVVGIEKSCEVLRSGIDFLLGVNEVVGVFAGIAGCGVEKNRTAIARFLKKQYPSLAIDCVTDIYNVIGSVPTVERGTVAICGTGSVVYAFDGKELHRGGGWGYLLDRAGSGFDIGREALGVAIAEREGHGTPSAITALVEKRLGCDAYHAIEKVYGREPNFIASFAPDVFEAHLAGDTVATEILEHNALRLSQLICRMSEMYDCGDSVVIAGGLLKDDGVYDGMIRAGLRENLSLIVPSLPQIFGSCIQCCRLCNIDTSPIEENFEAEYKKTNKEK